MAHISLLSNWQTKLPNVSILHFQILYPPLVFVFIVLLFSSVGGLQYTKDEASRMVLAINEDDNVRLKTYEGNMYGSITGVKGTGDLALDRIIMSALDNGNQTVRLEKPAAVRAEKTIPKILAGNYPLKFKHKARELFSDKLRDENGHKIIRSNAKISCPEGTKEYHTSTKTAALSTKQSTTAMKDLSDEFEDAHSPVNKFATATAEQKERERAATAAAEQKERERAATVAAQQKERERIAEQKREHERAADQQQRRNREQQQQHAKQQMERYRIAEQKREHERATDQQQRRNREQQQQQAVQQIRGYARQQQQASVSYISYGGNGGYIYK